jgi:dUTP pyrophosphatase
MSNIMEMNFTKTKPSAQAPTYSSSGAVGMDLYAHSIKELARTHVWYNTGIAVQVPDGYSLEIFARSSISETDPRVELANGVGIIDNDYRGEIQVRFNFVHPHPKEAYEELVEVKGGVAVPYTHGDRIAQMRLVPTPRIKLNETDDLSDTNRGDGGFGSTGS